MLSPFDLKLAKRLIKRIKVMAKNARRKGKSVRNGNSKSPYQKYQKRPYQYSSAYYDWKRQAMAGRGNVAKPIRGNTRGEDKRLMAAE